MNDVNFDSLFERFYQQIYQTQKGRLRMRLIDALYAQYLPVASLSSMNVLDVAGGLGQMSQWFLLRHAHVSYFDVSTKMVNHVSQLLASDFDTQRWRCDQSSVMTYRPNQHFDIVNVHALLEWLEKPESALSRIVQWVKPGGYLGLMIYNKHMLKLRHMMRGTLARAMKEDMLGDKKGLTPVSPLDPVEIEQYLKAAQFNIIVQAGIRTFSDLTEKTVMSWYQEEDVFNAELSLCQQRPYCDLGRYVLFIAQKQKDD